MKSIDKRTNRGRLQGRRRRAAVAAAAGGLALALGFAIVPYDRAALEMPSPSRRIEARAGQLLRQTPGADGTRAEWVPLDAVSPRVVQATLAAEDRRFYRHLGVDPLALGRAAWANLRARRIVSGGSTLTQQLAGVLWAEPRTPGGKLREAVRAVRLETDFSKREILEQYLNRIPYGPGVTGIAAASRAWFDRPPGALSAAQAATLAALPQAPGRLAREESAGRLRLRRDAILAALVAQGDLAAAEAQAASALPLDLQRRRPDFAAPHFADWVEAALAPSLTRAARIATTLDADLQSELEGIVRAQQEDLSPRGASEMAVVVQAVDSGEILSLVGSSAWETAQVNGALAARQPGSTLKPLVYAAAFDAGLLPADRLADLPLRALDGRGGVVAPRNYDGRWHGPVRAREALASSFNVPAVRVQERLGTERTLASLRAAGFATLTAPADHYGLGLVLGVGDVTLVELVAAYAALARGGVWCEPVRVRAAWDARGRPLGVPEPERRRFVDAASAFLVSDILADAEARVPGFGSGSVLDLPFAVAVKTGTSTDYRNSWCVGFTRDHAVGVWVGNFDGTSIQGLAGVAGAGPVFRSVMLHLASKSTRPWGSSPPPGWRREQICALSGDAPGPACEALVPEWFPPRAFAGRARCSFHVRAGGRSTVVWPAEYAAWARGAGGASVAASRLQLPESPRILSPVDGSTYFRDPRLAGTEAIRFESESPHPEDTWWIDGARLPSTPGGALWTLEPGAHRLELARGEARAVSRFVVR